MKTATLFDKTGSFFDKNLSDKYPTAFVESLQNACEPRVCLSKQPSMRYKLISITLFLLGVSFAGIGQPVESDFNRLAASLKNLKSLKYHSYREINNYKDNYFAKNSGTSYFEFDNSKEGGLSRFQLESDKISQVYNGTEYFCLYKTDRTYEIERRKVSSLSNLSLLFNSMLTLRTAIPFIVSDASIQKSVKDTLIEMKKFRLLKFSINKKALNFPAGFEDLSAEVIKYYELVVDVTNFLPYMIIDRNSLMGDQYFTKTIFTNVETTPQAPSATSWYFSSYTGYQPKERAERKALIAPPQTVPNFTFAEFRENGIDSIQLSAFKGKKVMMEFWIKNCGYCMAAFPGMKTLQQEYGANTAIVSVNAYEEKEEVAFFYKREKPQYKMLYGGEKLANQIGVYAYPSVVIIDEFGKVIYSKEGFNEKEISEVLSK